MTQGRLLVSITFVGLAVAFAAGTLMIRGEEPATKSPQTKCPVMGMPINKDIHLDYQGQRIYFCTPDCPAEFKKDPEKYFAKIADQNVLLESVQKNCPVTGEAINKQVFTDYKGRRVYFCCPACIEPFKKDPEKYLNKLQEQTQQNEPKPEHEKGAEHKHDQMKHGAGCGGSCG